ncbi:hypothetical protein Pse7367_0199 [Thalassoporum mexicanum PCC 7367]|uniref:AbiJ-NTD4 domain-containing protein n=1 Tax=Thalassoporum mexicanum TaxID=3457544 RepID=UPI00029FF670|nr:hypothetical protein [Pseudanabaena sp. PCC 7367]AFY68516.1 hypothetical protein Pse7367_0199 [Pseudanabaena sp. PCC 7367]
MTSFSERLGIEPVDRTIQIEGVNKKLKTDLWNAFAEFYWSGARIHSKINLYDAYKEFHQNYETDYGNYLFVVFELWTNFFMNAVDDGPLKVGDWSKKIYKLYDNLEWNEVFDFIEFIPRHDRDLERGKEFRDYCNVILDRGFSAYRFVGDIVAPITFEQNSKEIEMAMGYSEALQPVSNHVERALKFTSDRKSPDFANSIKESISAVEAICRRIAGREDLTLGNALIKAMDILDLDPNLAESIKKAYKYTCNSGGIRHAEKEGDNIPEFEDAQFMLVFCSSIVNYLTEKARKAGIEL